MSPTQLKNILDLFLTNEISNINVFPGISDHEIIQSTVEIIPKSSKQLQRKIYLYFKVGLIPGQMTWII